MRLVVCQCWLLYCQCWLISAYFPNSLEGTKATIKELRAVLNTLKTKEFLTKPRAARKRIGKMTIDNAKDQPHLPRTDDINVILHNFVEYYSKLYEHKKIFPVALDRLIKNLTLTLDTEEAEELDKPITDKDILAALIATPKGKSLGQIASHMSTTRKHPWKQLQYLQVLAT
jgi:hypothetical protein